MTYPYLLLRKINDRLQSNYSKRSFIHDNRMLAERAFYCLSSQISTKNLLIYHKQKLRQILFAYRIFPNRSIRSYIVPATAGVTSASAMCIKIPPETSFSLYLLYHRTEKPQAPGGVFVSQTPSSHYCLIMPHSSNVFPTAVTSSRLRLRSFL